MDILAPPFNGTLPNKRNRVLLSCAPCRVSKLKCDRGEPCSQCDKKQRPDACIYAPKPVKKKPPPKGMSARLKRLEGMVRNMMQVEGNEELVRQMMNGQDINDTTDTSEDGPKGHVVKTKNAPTYIGATHCMAILEDIEDMQTYFEEDDDAPDGSSPTDELDGAEMLLHPRPGPGDRNELLAQLPERHIMDRLITRYFASASPSLHVMHRPTFARKYAKFWQDPDSVSMHWIAQLFMVLALGLVFNHFVAPHELKGDSPVPVMEQIRYYRSCAAWALVWGKYTQPTLETLPAFVLYVEAYFLFNRAAQMSCYVLSGVLVRLMLKMGLHRDPSKLRNVTVYEGEMRRRFWNMATQIELLVSFHMGLPSIMAGIESDTAIPGNYMDDDFDEDTINMPPERSRADHSSMSYPITKTTIMRVFGNIARQAHALTPPTYADTVRLDNQLNETIDSMPNILKPKSLDESVGDSPALSIQRIGLASLCAKSRCVLHRRYLVEPVMRREHDYSRLQCLEAATTLLDYQWTMWTATRPGNRLSDCGWFMTSLSVHDYMLAAMIIYLIAQDERYGDSGDWAKTEKTLPTRDELVEMIRRSHSIWSVVSSSVGELHKTADTLGVMLRKLNSPVTSPDVSNGWLSGNGSAGISESSVRGAAGPTWSEPTVPSTAPDSANTPAAGPVMFAPMLDIPSMPSAGDASALIDTEFNATWMDMIADSGWKQLDVFGSNQQEGDGQFSWEAM